MYRFIKKKQHIHCIHVYLVAKSTDQDTQPATKAKSSYPQEVDPFLSAAPAFETPLPPRRWPIATDPRSRESKNRPSMGESLEI